LQKGYCIILFDKEFQVVKTITQMARKIVLITGITGFVGAYLTRRLVHDGHLVIGLYRHRSDGFKPVLLKKFDLLDDIKLVEGDVIDLTSLLNAVHEHQPDWIFHLAAQSFVPKSFKEPLGTFSINCLGTHNILEAVRLRRPESKVVFAGSSEEYGLQFIDQSHYSRMIEKYGTGSIVPVPSNFPEVPIDEQGQFRPLSPYATSKIYGDYLTRNYHMSYGLNTVVSRAFNHEGAGRGHEFVTSAVVRQVVSMNNDEQDTMNIGDVTTFRDWSHVEDIVDGYLLLAEKGKPGAVYVQGSMRTNSVLTYILKTISSLGHKVERLSLLAGDKKEIQDPLAGSTFQLGGHSFKTTKIDELLLKNEVQFGPDDIGLAIRTDKRIFRIIFDSKKFRPSDVPILLSNITKIKKLGFSVKRRLEDIVDSQINYYLDPVNRKNVL
jgi:GDPmannose 4,6-dehydratase